MTSDQKKILIIAMPFFGHLNPMTSIVYELTSKKNVKVIFFGTKEVKALIERTGSEFREYPYFDLSKFKRKPTSVRQDSAVVHTLIELMNLCHSELLNDLIKVVEIEKPDLIMHDIWALHTRYLLQILESKCKLNQIRLKQPPPSIQFTPFFGMCDGIYPNTDEFRMMVKFDFNYVVKLVVLFFKQMALNLKYGLYIFNPLKFFFRPNDKLNIVPTFPDLQPRYKSFRKDIFKFVGCCVEENVRSDMANIKNEKLKSFLNMFEPVNPLEKTQLSVNNKNNNLKLIYASLGTIFNNNMYIYEIIINTIINFDYENQATNCKVESKDLRVIISVGADVFKMYEEKITNERYKLPENVILLASAPQIDILKRASLFITHAGMNSASEAIHYGVPVICIPICVDQPLVALRICDELRLGKRFEYSSLTMNQLRHAIHEIIGDKSYLNRILEFSSISRKFIGNKTSADLIVEFMRNTSSKKLQ